MTINSLVRSPWLLAGLATALAVGALVNSIFALVSPPSTRDPRGGDPRKFTGRRQTAERSPSTSYGRRWSGMRL